MVFPHRLQTLRACGFRKAGNWSVQFFLALLLLTLSPAFCPAQTALDLDGKRVNPLNSNAGRPVVLVFVREDCPISRRYAPTIQRISDEHQEMPDSISSSPINLNRRQTFANICTSSTTRLLACAILNTRWLRKRTHRSRLRQQCSMPRVFSFITGALIISTSHSDTRALRQPPTNWKTLFRRRWQVARLPRKRLRAWAVTFRICNEPAPYTRWNRLVLAIARGSDWVQASMHSRCQSERTTGKLHSIATLLRSFSSPARVAIVPESPVLFLCLLTTM